MKKNCIQTNGALFIEVILKFHKRHHTRITPNSLKYVCKRLNFSLFGPIIYNKVEIWYFSQCSALKVNSSGGGKFIMNYKLFIRFETTICTGDSVPILNNNRISWTILESMLNILAIFGKMWKNFQNCRYAFPTNSGGKTCNFMTIKRVLSKIIRFTKSALNTINVPLNTLKLA